MQPIKKNKILIASLSSYCKQNKQFHRTAADQLKELFENYQIPVVFTEYKKTRLLSLIAAVTVIVRNWQTIGLAIVPLFGTTYSFMWQKIIVWVLQLFKIKIVLIVHGGSIPERMEIKRIKFLNTFKHAHAVAVPSNFMQSALQKFNVNTVVIENVISLKSYNRLYKQAMRPSIIWMRAFENTYNPEMAVRVANILAKRYCDFQMVMAGSDRGLLAPVKRMAEKYNLHNKITFPGYISLKQKLEYAKHCDIYICTNRIDNAPVSFIEFMSLGLPIVSVNVGGIPYIIKDGYNGMLVEFDNDAAMAQKIEELIEYPPLAHKIINNALDYINRHDEPIVMRKWFKLIEHLKCG